MPRYFFDVEGPGHGGGVGEDKDGTELPSDETAQEYARRIVHELRHGGGYGEVGLVLAVKSDTGATIFALPFS